MDMVQVLAIAKAARKRLEDTNMASPVADGIPQASWPQNRATKTNHVEISITYCTDQTYGVETSTVQAIRQEAVQTEPHSQPMYYPTEM
jgi:hypothetical protein